MKYKYFFLQKKQENESENANVVFLIDYGYEPGLKL